MKTSFACRIFLALSAFIFSTVGISQAQDTGKTTVSKDSTIILQVTGVTCGGDLPIICNKVKNEKGIKDCKAISKAGATTKFEVTYNPAVVSYEQLVNAVQGAPSCDYPDKHPYKVKGKTGSK